jgi:hypothetical protein
MMNGECSAVFGQRRLAHFSPEWEYLPVTRPGSGFLPPHDEDLAAPTHLDGLLLAARTLSKGIDFVRVDLYGLEDRVAFGEMTNYPSGGMVRFEPAEFDRALGARWQVPSRQDLTGVPRP